MSLSLLPNNCEIVPDMPFHCGGHVLYFTNSYFVNLNKLPPITGNVGSYLRRQSVIVAVKTTNFPPFFHILKEIKVGLFDLHAVCVSPYQLLNC
jgi:hypothetical protein